MKYEIQIDGKAWATTDWWIFRSWAGPRRVDGQRFVGPVYYLGTDRVFKATARRSAPRRYAGSGAEANVRRMLRNNAL